MCYFVFELRTNVLAQVLIFRAIVGREGKGEGGGGGGGAEPHVRQSDPIPSIFHVASAGMQFWICWAIGDGDTACAWIGDREAPCPTIGEDRGACRSDQRKRMWSN